MNIFDFEMISNQLNSKPYMLHYKQNTKIKYGTQLKHLICQRYIFLHTVFYGTTTNHCSGWYAVKVGDICVVLIFQGFQYFDLN